MRSELILLIVLTSVAMANLQFNQTITLATANNAVIGPVYYGLDLVTAVGNDILFWTMDDKGNYSLNLTVPVGSQTVMLAAELTPGSRLALQPRNSSVTILLDFDGDLKPLFTNLSYAADKTSTRTGTALAFSWENKRLFVGYSDGTINVWKLDSNDKYIQFSKLSNDNGLPVTQLAAGYGFSLLGLTSSELIQWDTNDSSGNYSLTRRWNYSASAVTMCPSADVAFAVGFSNGTIRVYRWDFDAKAFFERQALNIVGQSNPIQALKFSYDCRRLVSTSNITAYWLYNDLTYVLELEQTFPTGGQSIGMMYEEVAVMSSGTTNSIRIYQVNRDCSNISHALRSTDNGCSCQNNYQWNGQRCNYLPCETIAHSIGHETIDSCRCAGIYKWNSTTVSCELDCLSIEFSTAKLSETVCQCRTGYSWNSSKCLLNGNILKGSNIRMNQAPSPAFAGVLPRND